MKNVWNVIIVVLLLVLIVSVLIKNKSETDVKIELAERKLEETPVQVEQVMFGKLDEELVFTAIIKPIVQLHINAPVQGRVLNVLAKEGMYISKNALLIKTEDDYLRAEYQVDKKNYELAEKNLERVENLKSENAIPKTQYDQLLAQAEGAEVKKAITEKRLNETLVKSPVHGYINKIYVKKGMLINPSVPIGEVVDVSKFVVNLHVSENDVLHLKKGMQVNIIPKAKPEEVFVGEIKSISINADFALQYEVVIEFDNNTEWLRGGMQCEIKISLEDDQPGWVVPSSAIIHSSDSSYVYLLKDGLAKQISVNIVATQNGKSKVVGLLKKQDMIVVEGTSKLENNSKVKVIKNIQK